MAADRGKREMENRKDRPGLREFSIGVLFAGLTCLYVLLCFQNAAGSLMALIKPIGVFTAAWAVFAMLRFKLFPAQVYPELWLYGLYIVAACLPGVFLAQNRAAHIDIALRLVQALALVGSVYALMGLARSAKPVLWILALGAAVYAVYGLAVGFVQYRNVRQTLGNINANIFARVPLFAVPAAFGLMNSYRGWKRLAFLPLLAACIYVLLASGSRTALLACGAGVAVYIALTAPRRDLRRFYLCFLLPCAIAVGVLGVGYMLVRNPNMIKSIIVRVAMLFADGNGSTSLRVESIGLALGEFLRSPVFGVGAYQFSRFTLSGDVVLNHCHCDLAELLMAFGLVGTLLYCAAGYYGARGIVRTLRLEGLSNPPANSMAAAMASLFVVYLIVGFADITIYEVTCQFIWGALTACGMLNRLNGTAV